MNLVTSKLGRSELESRLFKIIAFFIQFQTSLKFERLKQVKQTKKMIFNLSKNFVMT